MKNLVMVFFFATLISQAAFSSAATYQVPRKSEGMVEFAIPFTFGVHEGTVKNLQGVVYTTDRDEVLGAQFQVSIHDMSTGNATRDCHMREALGIDYSKSRFPKEHVCDGNKLPVSGGDAVKYPNVVVELVNMRSNGSFALGVTSAYAMSFKVRIHGVTQIFHSESVMITKTETANRTPLFQVTTKLKLSLKDFGIKVKPATLGPVSINVKDDVSVLINAVLVKI